MTKVLIKCRFLHFLISSVTTKRVIKPNITNKAIRNYNNRKYRFRGEKIEKEENKGKKKINSKSIG